MGEQPLDRARNLAVIHSQSLTDASDIHGEPLELDP